MKPKQRASDTDDDEAPQCIGADKCAPHFGKVGENPGQFVGGYHLAVDGVLQHLRFLCRHKARTEAARSHSEQQCHAGGQCQTDAERFLIFFPYSGFVQYAFQGKDCQ